MQHWRRVWAPKGQRPIALGHHRYEWLYVTAFMLPATGETFWYVSNGVSKPFFAVLLTLFAREAGAGRERIIVLGLGNAAWHTAPNLVVPDGIQLVYLPRYSPELQPAEHLWPVLDEPLANQHFASLADLADARGGSPSPRALSGAHQSRKTQPARASATSSLTRLIPP